MESKGRDKINQYSKQQKDFVNHISDIACQDMHVYEILRIICGVIEFGENGCVSFIGSESDRKTLELAGIAFSVAHSKQVGEK